MNKLLRVSPSPHVYGEDSVPRLMYGVVISLLPALVISVLYFGPRAFLVTAVAVASCVFFEYIIQRFIMKTGASVGDGSAAVTGLLLAFCLPYSIPLWLVALGSLVAIGVGKMSFGGLGNNPFNPALVGRVFLFISFPVAMTSYPGPVSWSDYFSSRETVSVVADTVPAVTTGENLTELPAEKARTVTIDASSGATPLSLLNESKTGGVPVRDAMKQMPGYLDLLLGRMNGSLGEIAAAALLLGFIFLLIKKIITWHIPLAVLGSVFLFTGILWLANPESNADPLFHLLTGGLMLGAIYMATDYVTSPMSKKGMLIYGIGIGVITVLIRRFGAYPEGVQFAILIMNAFVPVINTYIKPGRFGEEVKNG